MSECWDCNPWSLAKHSGKTILRGYGHGGQAWVRREFVHSGSRRCTLKGKTLVAKQEDSQGQNQRGPVRPRTQSTNRRKEGKHRLGSEEARWEPGEVVKKHEARCWGPHRACCMACVQVGKLKVCRAVPTHRAKHTPQRSGYCFFKEA